MQNLKNNWLVISKLTWGIWWILSQALENLKTFYFNVLLFRKVYIAWAKKVHKSYLSWNWWGIQNLGRNGLAVSKLAQWIWQILTWGLKSLKDFHFNGLLMSKLCIVLAKKKYRGVIFLETEGGYKIWRGINSSFQNWHKEFDKIWPEHLKASKIFILLGFFWAKYVLFELKKYSGIIFHETEERYKIWRGMDLPFQNWHKEFDEIWPEHLKVSNIFILMGSFWAKYILFELKSTEE